MSLSNSTAGARHTHETKKSTYFQPYVNPALVGLFTPQTNNPATTCGTEARRSITGPRSDDHLAPFKEHDVYAYKTGYKSGGFRNSGIFSPADPNGDGMVFELEKAKGFQRRDHDNHA
ncbi:MAG: hypothetical protein IPK89_08360 [Sphingomonadales bacterium]|nr:hypothetical protein [Sphingomonadales bacterium]